MVEPVIILTIADGRTRYHTYYSWW